MILHYCDRCGRRIRQPEVDSGQAWIGVERSACAACRDLAPWAGPKETAAKEEAAPAHGAARLMVRRRTPPAGEHELPKRFPPSLPEETETADEAPVAIRRPPAKAPPAREKRVPFWVWFAAAGGVAVLVIAVVSISLSGGPTEGRVGGRAEGGSSAQTPKVFTGGDSRPAPADSPVMLGDLKPLELVLDPAQKTFEKGKLGYEVPNARKPPGDPNCIWLGNFLSPNGVSTLPPADGTARVVYELGGGYKTLVGACGIDRRGPGSATPLKFRVLGDGRVRWESGAPIQKAGERQEIRVNIEGVKRLELQVECAGSNAGAHAVWEKPRLVK
jgi:hypothetical protein